MILSQMTIYDYDNKPVTVELPEKQIFMIIVNVLSGDETGRIIFEDGTSIEFDASSDRINSYFDGAYIVPESFISEWVNFKFSRNRTRSYERQEGFYKKLHEVI